MSAPAFPAGYEVLEKVGEGGFGAVFKARQVALDRTVAIKLVHDASGVDVERFVLEGQAMSRLRHPAIVQVYAAELLVTGEPFLVFEWVEGRELHAEIEAGPMAGTRILEVFRHLLAGLDHAHGQGVVHRDVKPANLLAPRAGGLKIADFGLARFHESRERLTRTGMVVGTPIYMSPEQAGGEVVDARSDLYSAGVVLHEMLAGAPPFVSQNPIDILKMHVSALPAPVGERVTGVPDALAAVCDRLLAKDPTARPGAREALSLIEHLKDFEVRRPQRVRGTGRTRAMGRTTLATKPDPAAAEPGPRRLAPAVVAAAVGLVATVALAAWALRAPPAPPRVPVATVASASPAPPAPPDSAPVLMPVDVKARPGSDRAVVVYRFLDSALRRREGRAHGPRVPVRRAVWTARARARGGFEAVDPPPPGGPAPPARAPRRAGVLPHPDRADDPRGHASPRERPHAAAERR
jgi:tRNA A-37 threonylcarbamoyl transferase component Bud32